MEFQGKVQLLNQLSEEEAWILLQKHAGIEVNSSSTVLYEVAKGVAKECKGIPIAIEVVGTCLQGKSVDDWKIALDKLRDSKPSEIEEGVRDVFACMLLSYDYLTSSLAKSLFLMCGLFPNDHNIGKEDLFRYGLGLGLCGDVESFDTARSCVSETINKLVVSCLLMHSEEGQDHVKMHGVVRDAALWIASQEGCTIMVNMARDLEAKAKESFAVSSWYEEIHQLPDQLDAPRLEILLLQTKKDFELSNVSFEGLKVLKVMALINDYYGATIFPSLPQSTSLLTNLRILRLVGWELGDITALESLKGLEILDLHFSRFINLPSGITKLNKLRLLDLSWCSIEDCCYEVVGRCSQLEELYAFAIIEEFGRVDSYECFLDEATFPKLRRYALRIGQLYSEWLDVRYDISRRIIHIGEFNTSTLGTIMKDLLHRAEEVMLETLYGGCRSVLPEMVQAIGGMDDLTILYLRNCSEIEYFINAADSFPVEATLPRLVKLELINMSSLKQVCSGAPLLSFFDKLEELLIESCCMLQSIFPRTCSLHNLKTLRIHSCAMLTSLFSMPVARTLVQLQELCITECKELSRIIKVNEGDGGEGTSSKVPDEITCLMFSKLKRLSVYRCDKLECILPISCVTGLVLLRTVQIHECSGLNYFFGQHENEGHFSSQNENMEIELPCVELLQLIDLPNLRSLLPENYHSRWPSLSLLNCRGCPRLTTPHSELKQPRTITISYTPLHNL